MHTEPRSPLGRGRVLGRSGPMRSGVARDGCRTLSYGASFAPSPARSARPAPPMHLRFLPLTLLFLFFLTSPAAGQTTPTATEDGPWKPEHVVRQAILQDVAIAPDGKRVVWSKRTANLTRDRFETDLFLTYLDDPFGSDGPGTVQLTRTGNNSAPVWSPDGRMIAFLSARDGKASGQQLWLLDTRGGEPRQLTELQNGPRAFRWLDAERILFTAREDSSYYEAQLARRKDDTRVVEDTTLYRPVRLFSVAIDDGTVRRASENRFPITEFAPSRDGRYVVFSVDPSPVDADAREQPRIFLLDLQTGGETEIFTERYLDPSDFLWTANSAGFYASDEFSSDPENEGAGIQELYYFDVASMAAHKIPLDWPNGVGYGGYAVAEGGLHVQLADGPRMRGRFYYRTNDGWAYEETDDYRLRHTSSLTLGPDGRTFVYSYSRPDTVPAYYVARYERGRISGRRVLTELNGFLDELPIPKAEVIEWVGAEGDSINGILYYPLDYDSSRAYPLVVAIHGGPSGVDLDLWDFDWTIYPGLVTQRGAFMLRPNYHGSGHHGLAFVESIKGRYYELEVPDIVAGVDHLVGRGLVDRDSLGVMGWSNGAILTIALTVEHPDLFRVAAPGAGDVNWISDYGNCAFGVSFDDSYFGGPPWERLDHYIAKSPLFRMDRVRTPTLIQFGDQDTAVPTQQGWEHYRALQQLGNAPVRFVLFPGEPHGLRRPSHQIRKVEEDLAWFDTYLFGTTSMADRVARRIVSEASPLGRLEARRRIARDGGRYGVVVRGSLVPEVVTVGDSLDVGRFEVTRAQFQAFRPSYAVAPGTENHPVNGLSLEDARAYLTWLEGRTGARYRLPTARELEALRKKAGTAENNLAYWAGYVPTPEERALLQSYSGRFAPDDLLMPVGSRPPARLEGRREPLVFDLDGNVAEWATTADGARPATSSAVTVHDAKAPEPPPPPAAFIGLRVVRVR